MDLQVGDSVNVRPDGRNWHLGTIVSIDDSRPARSPLYRVSYDLGEGDFEHTEVHLASNDWPELGNAIIEHPSPELTVFGRQPWARTAGTVYEVGGDHSEPGYESREYTAADKVHPSHFGVRVKPPLRERPDWPNIYATPNHRFEHVPLEKTYAPQDYVYAPHVHNLASLPADEVSHQGHIDPVQGVKTPEGEVEIQDGAHRLAAAHLRGDKTIGVSLYQDWHHGPGHKTAGSDLGGSSAVETGDSIQRPSDLGAVHDTYVPDLDIDEGIKCPLCGIRPAEVEVNHATVCKYCANYRYGVPQDDPGPPLWGQTTAAVNHPDMTWHFDVDYAEDKDALKRGEIASGTHRVVVRAPTHPDALAMATQMVSARDKEPTAARLVHYEASLHEAMAWSENPKDVKRGLTADAIGVKSVRDAGFKGYVGRSDWEELDHEGKPHHEDDWDEDLHDKTRPEPNSAERAHFEHHGEYPDSYEERHDEAYGKAIEERKAKREKEDTPDHIDDHLHHFTVEHSEDPKAWTRHAEQPQQVDLRKGVYATQSHVAQFHIDRHKHGDEAWHLQTGGTDNGYLGNEHPLFVTHQGRLHCIEGHHRVAAAIQEGDSHIEGWHHNLDKHPIALDHTGRHECEECHDHNEWGQHEGAKKTSSQPGPGQGHYFEPDEDNPAHCAVCGRRGDVTAHPRKEAAFHDVRTKAKRLRAEGRVNLIQMPTEAEPYILGQVQGDHGTYHSVIHRVGNSIYQWLCECRWGDFGPFGPDGWQRAASSPYLNRKCSHNLALLYEWQAQRMTQPMVTTASFEPQDDLAEDNSFEDPYPHVGKDGEPHHGVMIALVPPDHVAKDLATEDGEDPYDMHVTLAYLGKDDEVDHDKIHRAMCDLARKLPKLKGKVNGFGNFEVDPEKNDGFSHVHLGLVDIPHVGEVYGHMLDSLRQVGLEPSHDHGLSPHMSIQYSHEPMEYESMPKTTGEEFDIPHITLGYGGKWRHYPLSGEGIEKEGIAHLADQPLANPGEYEYRLRVARPKSMDAQADSSLMYHRLDAFHKPTEEATGGRAGHAGHLLWHHKTGEIGSIEVEKEHRRKGLATEMLGQARQIASTTRGVPAPRHSPERTREGEAWARSTGDRLPRLHTAGEEHLPNPTGGNEWHHGTPHDFKHFDEEQDDNDDGDEGFRPDIHWNTHLGTHWTSLPHVAEKFARGLWNHEGVGNGHGHVFTANLGVKNPKDYHSETDMDKEAFDHAWDHHESFDPLNVHDRTFHPHGSENCYSLHDHEPGDEVDTAVREHYRQHNQQANWLSQHPDSGDIAYNFKRRLQEQGHDGVTYGNALHQEGPVGHRCAITFDTDQIHNLRRHSGPSWARTAALEPHEVAEADPDEFHQRFSQAMHGNSFVHHVTNHSPDEIRDHGMKPLTAHGGNTGLLVHDHGDGRVEATGLYNDGGPRGAGVDLLHHAIEHHGVNYVEAYGPHLPKLYRKAGFQTREQYPFDKELAHPDWDYGKFKSPNYHIMGLKGERDFRRMASNDDTEQHWGDPEWEAQLRAAIEAECQAEDPEHAPLSDPDWESLLQTFGV